MCWRLGWVYIEYFMESVRVRYLRTSGWCIRNQTRDRSEQVRFLIQLSLLFSRLSSIFFIEGTVFLCKDTKLFQSNFRDVFLFSAIKTLLYDRLSLNVCEATRKARALQVASAYKRREFWRETHTPLWLLIGRIIFLTREKTSFAIPIRRIFSLLWLARTHLPMQIFTSQVFSE